MPKRAIMRCSPTARSAPVDEGGFTLVEVLVAAGLVATGATVLAALLTLAAVANRTARHATFATVLAQQKMEQLRGLAWGFDGAGSPVTDVTTDISVVPFNNGGVGLSPSPAGSLARNLSGYVDYLDANGAWVGSGSTIPRAAVYIRRWSIEPLPAGPDNTLVLQVLVMRKASRNDGGGGSGPRLPEDARLTSVKTRKAP